MRISTNLVSRNVLSHISQRQEKLYELQMQTLTGRRINKTSDDPLGMARVMDVRSELNSLEQYSENINYGVTWLSQCDVVLSDIENLLVQGKEIGLACSQDTWPTDLVGYVSEVDSILTQMVSLVNAQHDDRYLFAGSGSKTTPYQEVGGDYVFCGTRDAWGLQIGDGITNPINLIGFDIFNAVPASLRDTSVDWDPTITEYTRLEDLNGGSGVAEGFVYVKDREGNEGNIDFHSVTTLKEAVATINDYDGLNVTASISEDGKRLVITDTSAVVNNDLEIDEVDEGTTASDLGILGTTDGDELRGVDLNPVLTERTKTSQLFGGEGYSKHFIRIQNGEDYALVDLKNVFDVGDIIDNIRNSEINVQAEINADGTGIVVSSTIPYTTLIIEETGDFSTAGELGIRGTALPMDVIQIFEELRTSLNRKDREGIESTLDKFDDLIDSVLSGRAEGGARINLLELSNNRNLDMQINLTEILSETQDADYTEVITKFSTNQIIYQAALATSAQILSNSLSNFLS